MTYRLPTLAANIKAARLKRGYTLEQLARKVGTSKSYIWEIESGKKNPGFLLVYDIAHILKISLKKIACNTQTGSL